MIRVLADECRPKAVVERLRRLGLDVRYAAETDHRASDADLLTIANADGRVILTEDFDFGDLLVRDQLPVRGAIILFLPKLDPEERASRLVTLIAAPDFVTHGRLTIVEAARVRQRPLRSP